MTGYGTGERIERQRRRRKLIILATLFTAGLATGAYVGRTRAESLWDGSTDWPPALAIALCVVWVAALGLGSIALRRSIDEVERRAREKAVAVAAAAYFVVYPIWFLLWKGDFVAEPMHGMLFIGFWLALAGASIFYRFR